MDFATWLTVFTVGVFIVLSPGPNWAVTIKNSLVSRKHGFLTVAGMAAGSLVHIAYCLVGIGVVISQSIVVFNLLKWVGALYLLYLGVKSLMAQKRTADSPSSAPLLSLTPWQAARNGFLTDLLNPKATLFYLSLFTQVIQPGTPLVAQSFYGLSVVIVEVTWYSLMVVFLNHRFIRHGFLAISHWIERVTGAVLIAFGFRLALSKAD
jgi:RhtB (resistance to homoserine/threonine) family protein